MSLTVFFAAAFAAGWSSPGRAETRWSINASIKYDAMCLTGILADDRYQTQFYWSQRDELVHMLSPATVAAGAKIHRAFKDAGVPTSGFLGLVFSSSDATDLDGVIAATLSPAKARARLEASRYWDAARWDIYEHIRPALVDYLRGLKNEGFEKWWRSAAAVEVEDVLVPLRPRLENVQFAALIDRLLDRPGPATITVHATRLCRPFGARLLGDAFLMDVVGKKDPFRSVGAGAIHEMTHPPFDPKDPRIVRLMDLLQRDPVLAQRFAGRPREAGYNSFEGYLNEDVTRALDQIIGERVGVTFIDDADERFRTQEGGFHMAAAVFYHLMKQANFLDGEETVTEFLDRMMREGQLAPERVREIVARVENPVN